MWCGAFTAVPLSPGHSQLIQSNPEMQNTVPVTLQLPRPAQPWLSPSCSTSQRVKSQTKPPWKVFSAQGFNSATAGASSRTPSSSGQESPRKTLCSSPLADRNSPWGSPRAASTRLGLILLQHQLLSEGDPAKAGQEDRLWLHSELRDTTYLKISSKDKVGDSWYAC